MSFFASVLELPVEVVSRDGSDSRSHTEEHSTRHSMSMANTNVIEIFVTLNTFISYTNNAVADNCKTMLG